MEKYRLVFANGDRLDVTVEDYSNACWRAEEYEYDYDTKLKYIYEMQEEKMNYLDIKKDLMGFWKELGYEELIKGIFSFELSEENEKILNKLYE